MRNWHADWKKGTNKRKRDLTENCFRWRADQELRHSSACRCNIPLFSSTLKPKLQLQSFTRSTLAFPYVAHSNFIIKPITCKNDGFRPKLWLMIYLWAVGRNRQHTKLRTTHPRNKSKHKAELHTWQPKIYGCKQHLCVAISDYGNPLFAQQFRLSCGNPLF